MFRNLSLWAMAFAAVLVPAVASADTFFTGRVDTSTALGGTNLPGAKLLQIGSGVAYSNKAGGDATSGTVNVVGAAFVPTFLRNNNAGNTASDATRFLAVFALQGDFVGDLAANNLQVDFEGGLGQVRFYDLGAGGGGNVDFSDPSTWTAGATLVGQIDLTGRPTGILQGPPGGVATEQAIGFNAAEVNTASGVAGVLGAQTDASVIFSFDESNVANTYFDFLASYLVDPDSPAFLIDLITQVIGDNGIEANVADLEALFLAMLGQDFTPGADIYDPSTLGVGTGDVAGSIQIGGRIIPGSLVGVEIPEPASMITWTSILVSGAGIGWMRRRRNTKA